MKHMSFSGGEWREFVDPQITPDEMAALNDMDPSRQDARLSVLSAIRERRVRTADAADIADAQAVMESHLPAGAEFASCDVNLPEGTGIINCRLNGEHKQIRF